MPGRLTHERLEGYLAEVKPPSDAALAAFRALRARLLAHEDVEEEWMHLPPPARLMYRTSCNQVATLGFGANGLGVGIRLTGHGADELRASGLAAKHPEPIYARSGWLFAAVPDAAAAERLVPWLERAHRISRANDACLS